MTTNPTDSQHWMEQLRKAEARFRIICQAMPVGLLIVSPEGTLEFINRKVEQIFAKESDEIVGSAFTDLLLFDGKSFPSLVQSLQERGGRLELEAIRGEHEPFSIELTIHDFEIGDRNCYLVTVMDISDRREVERMKQQIMAMVSHDLSTPLSSIQTTLNLLALNAGGELNERGTAMVQRAERSAAQLVKLVNDLLTVEQLESGKISLFREPMSFADLFEKSTQLLADFAAERKVSLHCDDGNVHVVADFERLKQVVSNFISNAIKFSPENAIVKIVAARENGFAEVRVLDQGRGVPQRDQKRIFERFQQVEQSDASEKGGRGLGLAICKAIIVQHGGEIGVISEEGAGSTFWFRIPADK